MKHLYILSLMATAMCLAPCCLSDALGQDVSRYGAISPSLLPQV